ncbi:Integral membrane protein TerC [Acidothermus cellulolyticus 11B]|uniref:Integral membrane protein TerC n=1 Tax=Acidothermus cellulolyticus (strain ATCC 43068 / DSM 8971 / 11B) TaxID=351607 RepID=A0LT82_ACIC1|nr:TerC/Alx family metal homeostasis membrane protein [Acidothermus cellulolyticus]ABK52642.1 Integral membrane protein TerC [Acidothermus cellulolyticus 11B]
MLIIHWWVYLLTIAVLGVLIVADVWLSVRRPHVPSMREAAAWIGLYVGLAAVFAAGLGLLSGWRWTGEFVAGWLTEYSLSVDNIFVFALLFVSFGTPAVYQQKALLWGIVIALVLRGAFIAAGAAAIQRFTATFYVFGAILFITAVQLLRSSGHAPDPKRNPLWRLAARVLPTTDSYAGGRIVTRDAGRWVTTPLFLVLIAIGTTDVLFALDSIPAIYGLTREPYIVLTANAFALMGLRQLYFLLLGLLGRLRYLRHGLAVILGFIGVKLVLEAAHQSVEGLPEVPIWLSLAVIFAVLAVTTLLSVLRTARPAPVEPARPSGTGGSSSDARSIEPGRRTSSAPPHR